MRVTPSTELRTHRAAAAVLCGVLLGGLVLGGTGRIGRAEESTASPSAIGSIEILSQAFRDLARNAGPGVVFIEARTAPTRTGRGTDNSEDQGEKDDADKDSTQGESRRPDLRDLPEPLRKFFEQREDFFGPNFRMVPPQQRGPTPSRGSGSGVIIDAEAGYVLTNYHVVEEVDAATNRKGETSRLDIRLADGRRFTARIIGKDPKTDLALLQLNADKLDNLVALPLGDSSEIQVGDWVVAIGAPFGYDQTVTQGIISAKGRNPRIIEGYEDFIQTDAAINPGNSGGPLLNMRGEVIGINTAIVTRGVPAFAGIGFAIPSQTVKELLPLLKEGKEVVRGYLGVAIAGLDSFAPGFAKTFGLPDDTNGILIEDVLKDSPSGKAGLKMDDVILAYNDRPVTTVADLQKQVARTTPGTVVSIKVWRDGKEINIPVTIEKQPAKYFTQAEGWGRGMPGGGEEASGSVTLDALGMTVEILTAELAKKHGWEGDKEVQGLPVVTEVEPLGEAAAGLGIAVGDIILSVQGNEVRNLKELSDALSREALSQGVRLRVKSAQTGRSRSLFEHLPQ